MKIFLRIVFAILIIINTIIIFSFSSQNGEESTGISYKVTTAIANVLNIEEKENFIEKWNQIIRKLAHFSIYTSLGIWSMAFASTFKINDTKRLIGTSIWGIIYAITDEVHQLFTNGRNGSVMDVLIDSLGIIFGACIVLFITILQQKNSKKY